LIPYKKSIISERVLNLNQKFTIMTSYIVQAVLGAVVGYVGNYIPFVKNNQSTVVNAVLGIVGGLGGNAIGAATGLIPALMEGQMASAGSVGSGVVGSIVALLAGKLFKK
jgi:uncharacterized membrane protein YeaQ/YmgE (transglycosylase-associated protein family)